MVLGSPFGNMLTDRLPFQHGHASDAPQPLHQGGGLQQRCGCFPGGSAPALQHGTLFAPSVFPVYLISRSTRQLGSSEDVCVSTPLATGWLRQQHCRQSLQQMLCPGWGCLVGSLAHPDAPPASLGQGDPSARLSAGGSPAVRALAAPTGHVAATAVDSQALTLSPGAEPEMLFQARLKCTKCSTCKICSVRK